jgi:hypothetical protein
MQPRGFGIASMIESTRMGINQARAALKVFDKMIARDTENYQHLTGRVIDKTAGRNQLGLRNGK